jgi:diguanylate cyclase (GGDEF)-like protein
MSQPELKLQILKTCLDNFKGHFNQTVTFLIQSALGSFITPEKVDTVNRYINGIQGSLGDVAGDGPDAGQFMQDLHGRDPVAGQVLKQAVLYYRRDKATYTETLLEKTFHPELSATIEKEIKTVDALTSQDWFQAIPTFRLPHLTDYLSIQFVEESTVQRNLPDRLYDEKFHILQAPALFLPDLAYFRAKCEVRDVPLTIAFIDIDDFKSFNTKHSETKVDRNLLPLFMQTLEAHLYHHGFAYRQGGDEYLILLPSLSKPLAVAFLDELRCKLAELKYPDINGSTTVSIGVCIAEADCPLTDRELLERANQAKKFAKDHGKNCLATYDGPRFVPEELRVARPER